MICPRPSPAPPKSSMDARYVDTDLIVQLVGINICARNQKATFEGTPQPYASAKIEMNMSLMRGVSA